jgi:glyoxylase-like metal-dependent hydrolase (beta-lactamase superfamily II)
VLLLSTQATVLDTSCYVLAPGPDSACLVVDPGAGAAEAIAPMLEEHGLRPVAVAATHGHADHIWDAAAVADRWDVPFLLAEADQERLEDPASYLGPAFAAAFEGMAATPWSRPRSVEPLREDALPGLELAVSLVPAPGHTPGSTVLLVREAPDADSVVPRSMGGPLPATDAVALTGDVLFAGSVGRVDLPGGDGPTMKKTLAHLKEALPPQAWVLPGHGPSSLMQWEQYQNPYLNARWLASGAF